MATKEKDTVTKALEKEKVETWSQRTEKDGVTECISVEKLANHGYLVTLNKYGRKGNKGDYFDVSRKLYSDTNPLDKDEESDTPFNEMFKMLSNKN